MSPPSILHLILLCIALPMVLSSSSQGQMSSSNGGNQSAKNQTSPRRTRPPVLAREFLAAHNKIRMDVTHPLFEWDRTLARYARRWGMKCATDCKMAHSYGPYGENLFKGTLDHWTPTKAVESWAGEKEHYAPHNNSCAEGKMCGHYTQIIWRGSVKIGCTLTKCLAGGVLVICEYDPPGNYVNESPFHNVTGDATPAGAGMATNNVPNSK